MPEWISVKERLPGYGDYVLCIGPKWGYYICEYRGLILGLDLASRIPYFTARGKSVTVTHWMPLPEPPKEGGDGMINSELRLEEEPKPHKCSCGATPRFTYNGLLWVVECPMCFNIESGWTALGVINAWNRRVDKEGGGEDGDE